MEKIKIIHQIWCNKYNDIPDSFLKLSATWKELHPDWEYRFWTEKD
jgi:mannosyltransferase OCH1-like enzyme